MKIYKEKVKSLLFLSKLKINSYLLKEDGFSLTQILVLSIGVSIALTGLIAATINRYSTARINSLELQAKNANESGISIIRSLFNNSKGGAFYYFWLAKACSIKANNNECPQFGNSKFSKIYPGKFSKGNFPDLSKLYWTDNSNKWCNGINYPQCAGRQVAPVCTYLGQGQQAKKIDWNSHRSSLRTLLLKEQLVSSILSSYGTRNNSQIFSLKSIDYVGNEEGGENSILIEGYTKTLDTGDYKNAANKLRANIQVIKTVSSSGFGFISAGENERDVNSLFLGNLITSGDKIGSIIWRKNLYSSLECSRLKDKLGVKQSSLPDNNKANGGVWVQPLGLPPKPTISRKVPSGYSAPWSLGPVVCTQNTSWQRWTNCRFLETDGWDRYTSQDRTVTVDDLIVKGKDAFFGIVTSDTSRVTLVIKGSVDVSNGGRICNRHKSKNAACGSGKPENLTIVFEQPGQNVLPAIANKSGKQELECSPLGGMQLTKNQNLPFNSFLVSHTGDNYKESFSAFIYAPETTFTTSITRSKYYQNPKSGSKLIVTFRGIYGYLNNPENQMNVQDRAPRVLKSPNGKLIPFESKQNKVWDPYMKNIYIIAIGSRPSSSSPSDNSMLDMALVWDSGNDSYSLRGLVINSNEARFTSKDIGGRRSYINLGNSPFIRDRKGNRWIDYYGIELVSKSTLVKNKYYKGAAWTKNFCLDQAGSSKIYWEFDKDFSKNLVKRFNKSVYNYGVPYYRGKSIKSWDTLRDFYQN
tara:strand:+ start:18285 stop:20540 length:2256 start_codon:yes stop_codon:yes gene_type:complete